MLIYLFSLNVAPDPPIEVVISMVTSTTATLSWQAPLDPQGIIASYNVSYNQTIPCSGNVSSFEIMLTRDDFTYTFVDLEEATNYVFSVMVMNGVRESEAVSVTANTSESSKFYTTHNLVNLILEGVVWIGYLIIVSQYIHSTYTYVVIQ